jgi:hypothetical protein
MSEKDKLTVAIAEGLKLRAQLRDEQAALAEALAALGALRIEAETMRDGDRCDHKVNICWCGYFSVLNQVDEALRSPAAKAALEVK